jgi:hypothetical protein
MSDTQSETSSTSSFKSSMLVLHTSFSYYRPEKFILMNLFMLFILYFRSRSSKNTRKAQRKMWSLKEGNPREEQALVSTLSQLIQSSEKLTG